MCALSLPHGGGKHGRDAAKAHERGRHPVALRMQGAQHTGTCQRRSSESSAAQVGSGGEVGADHGKKSAPIMPPLPFRHSVRWYLRQMEGLAPIPLPGQVLRALGNIATLTGARALPLKRLDSDGQCAAYAHSLFFRAATPHRRIVSAAWVRSSLPTQWIQSP